MATQAQIDANRKNAQKSTGPKTPEGRDAVRLNGLKHGLTSEILVLPGESIADFEALLDSLQAEHQPASPTEVILVRQMAMAAWRIQRLIHMEAAHFSLRRSELDVHFKGFYTDLREPDRQAIIAERDIHQHPPQLFPLRRPPGAFISQGFDRSTAAPRAAQEGNDKPNPISARRHPPG